MISTTELMLTSEGDFQAFNITDQVTSAVEASGVKAGQVTVFYRHTTGTVLIAEHEAGLLVDVEDALEKISPVSGDYKHHLRGFDTNGAAHIRTALLGVSVCIPVLHGELMLGSYQEVLVIDMDPQQHTRQVVIQVIGE